ncbi:methyl-accepting chemotaxis protein [Ponticaulis profundi]|uniref:PAS domain S-box protein n=1 Tax=Ponticaulis profundi TaxID=2665222 RepID=A0ABW1SCF0_9PROT
MAFSLWNTHAQNDSQILSALNRSQAIIKFSPDGVIESANKNFLNLMGYREDEVVGKHHRMFVDPEESAKADYAAFWDALRSGEFRTDEYRRVTKSGKSVWIQATYNPIMNDHGQVTGIVKLATDISAKKSKSSTAAGVITAINQSQAVIHFAMDGTIQEANENFCKTVGYESDEIVGKRHAIFVPEEERGPKYEAFWRALSEGKAQSGEFKRINKHGKPIYIQATYTPILNFRGKAYKVIKFATDITDRVLARNERQQVTAEIDRDLTSVEEIIRRAAQRAEEVARASAETSSSVENVASGSSQLANSVDEISQQASKAYQISEKAVDEARATNGHILKLSQSADQIGAIISLISDIAEQTNLLALNATIEAARAGEAGKGFAVVASEVKQLATQSAKASGDISKQISAVQDATRLVVSAIEGIEKIITDVNAISMSISGAVEEQAAVTRDISSNMMEATNAVGNISDGINTIAEATREVQGSTQKVKALSASIAS